MRRITLLIALALSIQSVHASEWADKMAVRKELVELRNVISMKLYRLEALNNKLDGNTSWWHKDYEAILDDAHRLYMDCEVQAVKLGAKPLHKEIVDLRKGHLYAWQDRAGAENDGFSTK